MSPVPLLEASNKIQGLREDPNFFVRRVLGHDPWNIPEQIAMDLAKPNARVAVKACHSSGKCVAANEPILLSNGKRVLAMDLVGTEFIVLTSTPKGFIEARATAEWNMIEQVYSVTTDSGRKITRNADHPLFHCERIGGRTAHIGKWEPVRKIHPGSFVAVPCEYQHLVLRDDPSITDAMIDIFAFLTSNMGVRSLGPVVRDAREYAVDTLATLCDGIGAKAVPSDNTDPVTVPFEITSDDDNPVIELMETFGLTQYGHSDIRVPEIVMTLPEKRQARFLSRLFAVGGYVDGTNRNRISYYTYSEKFARDLQHMLLVQKILCVIEKIDADVWRVQIDKVDGCVEFLRTVGIFGQEAKCLNALEKLVAIQNKRPQEPEVPWQRKGFPALNPGLMWERVAAVDLEGVKATVAIEVPGYHTYLTNFQEHNTHTAADLVFWFVCTGGKAITTAPSWEQVEKLLWGEMRKTYQQRRELLGGDMLMTQYRLTEQSYAFGLSTDRGVRFHGHHDSGGGLLIVIDEGPGVKEEIWESIEGIRAGGDVRILTLGNPVHSGGPFFDAFGKDRRLWKTYTISAFDTPNIIGYTLQDLLRMSVKELDENERPYLVTRRWVVEKYYQWGEGDPRWQSRVLGEFPDQGTYDLFATSWVLAAATRKKDARTLEINGKFQAGVDVAGAGADRTVATIRKGYTIIESKAWSQEDPRHEVAEFLLGWNSIEPLTVMVDSIGIGHYFIKHLQDTGLLIIPVNVSNPPSDDGVWIWDLDPNELPSKRFGNLKAQLYFILRDLFKENKIINVTDEELRAQLKTIQWKENETTGKIWIKSKEQMKREGIDSPDLAESLMLAFAEIGIEIPVLPSVGERVSGWGML